MGRLFPKPFPGSQEVHDTVGEPLGIHFLQVMVFFLKGGDFGEYRIRDIIPALVSGSFQLSVQTVHAEVIDLAAAAKVFVEKRKDILWVVPADCVLLCHMHGDW